MGLFARSLDNLLLGLRLHGRKQGQGQGEVDGHRPHDHGGQERRVDKQDDDGDDGHQAIDDGGDDAMGQDILDGRGGPEPGEDVAHMALFEPVRRQPDHVADQVPRHLETEHLAECLKGPGAEAFDRRLKDDEGPKPQGQDGQEVPVCPEDRLIHHQLHLEGQGEGCDLQGQGQTHDLQEGRPEARHL